MAYTEFYCDPVNGSNLNAGSTTDAAAVYTAANGGWDSGTGVFTPASGDPSATVSVGMFASVFLDAATVGVFVGRVTAVDSTTITVSLTAKMGTAPATGANGRTIKVGGAWKGPNGAEAWPIGTVENTLKNVAGDFPRVNFKNSAEYDITATLTQNKTGPIIFNGYSSSVDDGGLAVFDGQNNNITIFVITGFNCTYANLEVKNNATGNGYGFSVGGQESVLVNCVAHNVRSDGFYIQSNYCVFIECEAYSCNVSNSSSKGGFTTGNVTTFIRCDAHDNSGSNASGFRSGGLVTIFENCISDTNGAAGLALTGTGLMHVRGCDIYNNSGDGIDLASGSDRVFIAENCNLFLNGGWGINQSGGGNCVGLITNCAFGSGTKANTSGTITGISAIYEVGSVIYTANQLPWNDAPNGDFTLTGAPCRGTGRGTFTQTASSYGGTVSKPDIGAAARGGTFPAVANTRYGVTYGAAGIEYTGLLEIPNSGTPTGTQDATSDDCVVSGKKYGSPQRTGTAAGGGGYTYGDEDPDYVLTTADGAGHYHPPEAAEVISTATFGADGIVAGTYDVSDVAEGNIIAGASIGGVAGTYPLTATTQAADAAVLEAEKAYLLATKTITFGASSVVGTLAVANVLTAVTGGTYHAPEASEVQKGAVVGTTVGTLEGCVDSTGTNQGTTGLLVAGTFYATGWWDGLAYEAAPDFPAVGNVYNDTVDGEAGTLTFADTTYVLDTAPDYGVAGTGGAKTATLPATSVVLTAAWGGPATYGVGGTGSTPQATLTLGANVISSASSFGKFGALTVPTYHEALTTEVKDGVTFGALSALTGTYSPGGTYAEGQASIIAALVLPAADRVDSPEMYGVNLAGYEAYYLEGTGLNATSLLTALGMASGDLDSQLAGLDGKLDTITTAVGSLYWAAVRHVVNDTTGQDEWTIVPMKDGVAQTSATLVTLTVTKRSDGTALINAQSATQVGATSVWKYTALTSERIYDGTDSYVAVVTFTCDAGSRTAPPVIVARDG